MEKRGQRSYNEIILGYETKNGGGGIMKKEKKVKDTSVSVSNVYRLEGRVPVSRVSETCIQGGKKICMRTGTASAAPA